MPSLRAAWGRSCSTEQLFLFLPPARLAPSPFGSRALEFRASGTYKLRSRVLTGPLPNLHSVSQCRRGGSVLNGCPPFGVRFWAARFGLATLHFFISHSYEGGVP